MKKHHANKSHCQNKKKKEKKREWGEEKAKRKRCAKLREKGPQLYKWAILK